MFAIPDLKNKSESEILQALHEYESNDPIENSRIGTEVWNMAVGLKKNSPFVAQLRLFGIDKMELGFERGISMISREMEIIPDFYNHFKLIQMMITTCDCFYACMDYEAAQLVLDRAYALFSKVKNSPDTAKYHLSGLNLKFHTCLLQWATTNNSTSFQLANVAINEAIEHIGEPEIKKLFKSCVKLADLSKELIDKDKWLQLFSAALDKSNCERRQYDAFRLDIGLLRGEVLIKLKNIQDAELLIGNLMQEYFCSAKLYYLSFQLLELKNGSKQEFLHLLQDFKDKAVKSDRNVVYSILHMLAQNGCAKDALIAFDALSNCDVTAREQILIHKLHIILSQNSQDDYIATTEILQEFGDFNNTSEISKQIMIMLWKRGDLAGSQSEYNDAIQWYELSSRHLLPNLVDSRNNAKLQRKIAYCQLKLGLPCLDTALKSVGLDPRPNHNSSFLLFQVYLGMDDIEQALKNLKEISYLEHAEYYLAAADYAYQVFILNDGKQTRCGAYYPKACCFEHYFNQCKRS